MSGERRRCGVASRSCDDRVLRRVFPAKRLTPRVVSEGRRGAKRRGDEACLGENLASAKWRRDAASLESKGQPEDRWQANHVENESRGKCTGRGWRPLRGVHLSLTGPGLTWNKTSSMILHYACQLAPSPRDTPTTLFSVQRRLKKQTHHLSKPNLLLHLPFSVLAKVLRQAFYLLRLRA